MKKVIRISESELRGMVKHIANQILRENYKVVSTDDVFEYGDGKKGHSVLTLKDEHGGETRVIEDDGCYVPYQRCVNGKYEKQTYIYPELFNAMKEHLPNLPLH
jgi:hypothetical protein